MIRNSLDEKRFRATGSGLRIFTLDTRMRVFKWRPKLVCDMLGTVRVGRIDAQSRTVFTTVLDGEYHG